MRLTLSVLTVLLALAFPLSAQEGAKAPASAWRSLEAENTLYLDLPAGRVVIELYPEIAPQHVERIKTLTRQGFYDGLPFHRVIDGFMAQTGNPPGDASGSDLADLPLEAQQPAGELASFVPIVNLNTHTAGFLGAAPMLGEGTDRAGSASENGPMRWITHCRGVASMARRNIPRDSANSQFFIMFDHTPSLDRQYSAWGRVILGQEHVDAINRGSPPDEPSRIASMQVASDVEESARWSVEVVDTASDWFQASISQEQRERLESYGGRVSICDLMPPGRRSGGN